MLPKIMNNRSLLTGAQSGSRLLIAAAFGLICFLCVGAPVARAQSAEMLSRLVQASGSDAATQAFTEGRDLIAEEKWSRAASRFNRFISDYPNDKNLDAAFYWLAFAYKKMNKFAEAERTLGNLMARFPKSAWADDAKKMRVEMSPFLNPKIAEDAAKDADTELKVIALKSLCESEPQRCVSLVSDVLKPGSRSPVGLKEAAIMLLGRFGGREAIPMLTQMARNEQEELKLRAKAISALGSTDDESVIETLRELAMRNEFFDYGVVDTSLHSLAQHDSPRAVGVLGQIALTSPNVEARKHAVFLLSRRKGEDVVDELFRIYDAAQSMEVKKQVLEGLGNRKSPRAVTRLADIARNGPTVELRAQAIQAIPHRNDDQDLDILLSLYDSERDEELKDFILDGIGHYRENKRALQKLMEVVRSNAPVERRKKAISALSHSKDPDVLKFLEDMLR